MSIVLLDTTPQLREPPPLSLYVHFPWCVRKCPYCDFNSHTARDTIPETAYIDALIADLESALPMIWGRTIHSIFMGGGTPSLISAAGIDRLLTGIRTLTQLDPMAEITLEANPGTADAANFAGYRSAGINRLSIGVQSFDNTHLQALGRIHDGATAHHAIELAQRHFDNINLDLMYGLPHQTLAEALNDLETALQHDIQHLSCYHLTLEPNTPFYQHPPDLPNDDITADMQDAIEARLAAAGFRHYETSAFAGPRQHTRTHARCWHNLNYWQFGDYLGIGAGAHSKLSSHDGIRRQIRHPHPKAYLDNIGNAILQENRVETPSLGFEFMMNALRLTDGFDPALFSTRTGLGLQHISRALKTAEQRGLISRSLQRIQPTATGRHFLNDLLTLFLPDNTVPR